MYLFGHFKASPGRNGELRRGRSGLKCVVVVVESEEDVVSIRKGRDNSHAPGRILPRLGNHIIPSSLHAKIASKLHTLAQAWPLLSPLSGVIETIVGYPALIFGGDMAYKLRPISAVYYRARVSGTNSPRPAEGWCNISPTSTAAVSELSLA